jgi:DNA-binding NarL/FixJ family response regulator
VTLVGPARVFVAAEDAFLRSALRLLLENEEGVAVVGEGGEPGGLVEQVRATDPDLVLVTWGIARQPGPGVVAALKGLPSHPRVIALNCCPEDGGRAGRSGADGLVGTGESPERLLAVVRGALRG